jgi:hypothetical protein
LPKTDLSDRAAHLKLPLENMPVFEQMLEDRKFRLQIVEGNEKIEHIVGRTQAALTQTMDDVNEGLTSTRQFSQYLADQKMARWRLDRPDVSDIYEAMRGNADGWYNALQDLQSKGSTLRTLIMRLNNMVAEMEHKAGEVSRRTRVSCFHEACQAHVPHP